MEKIKDCRRPRKIKRVVVSPKVLLLALCEDQVQYRVISDAVPDYCEVISTRVIPETQDIEFTVWSDEFEVVPECNEIPCIRPDWKYQ